MLNPTRWAKSSSLKIWEPFTSQEYKPEKLLMTMEAGYIPLYSFLPDTSPWALDHIFETDTPLTSQLMPCPQGSIWHPHLQLWLQLSPSVGCPRETASAEVRCLFLLSYTKSIHGLAASLFNSSTGTVEVSPGKWVYKPTEDKGTCICSSAGLSA